MEQKEEVWIGEGIDQPKYGVGVDEVCRWLGSVVADRGTREAMKWMEGEGFSG